MEAVEYEGIDVYGVDNLDDVLRILGGEELCDDLLARNQMKDSHTEDGEAAGFGVMDFSEIIGQEGAKRGIEIAAAGGHNVIRFGFLLTGSYIC